MYYGLILSKYMLFVTVQERLNKVTDCEQLKHCGDPIEQLRFLLEESTRQRFVVNINVPSQVTCYYLESLSISVLDIEKSLT